MDKLRKVLMYLNSTSELALVFREGDNKSFEVLVFIDASYGIHEDLHSQSGLVVSSGGATAKAGSWKQQTVAKSACEAEIVALSDHGDEAQHATEVLKSWNVQSFEVMIMEDNQAAVGLLKRGQLARSNVRHIAIKCAWIQKQISSGKMKIGHCETEIANYMT